jgi:hypothetical protein
MGLDMKDKKKACGEIARQYQKAGKKGHVNQKHTK